MELAKSNAYITAANEGSGAFGKALATYQDTISSRLSGDRPLENYAVVPVHEVTRIRTRLEAAGAMAGSIPELDPAARDYAAAVAAFEPVNKGLANYAQSWGFLTDGGAKARAEDAAFVASLTKVEDAETVFFDRIAARRASDARGLRQGAGGQRGALPPRHRASRQGGDEGGDDRLHQPRAPMWTLGFPASRNAFAASFVWASSQAFGLRRTTAAAR